MPAASLMKLQHLRNEWTTGHQSFKMMPSHPVITPRLQWEHIDLLNYASRMILLKQFLQLLLLLTLKLSPIPSSSYLASISFTKGLGYDSNCRSGINTKVTNFCHGLLRHPERSITCWRVAAQISIATTAGILRRLRPHHVLIKASAPTHILLAQFSSNVYACM